VAVWTQQSIIRSFIGNEGSIYFDTFCKSNIQIMLHNCDSLDTVISVEIENIGPKMAGSACLEFATHYTDVIFPTQTVVISVIS
jgi:hypothetical protein